MRRCGDQAELEAAFDSVAQLAGRNFKDSGVYLEKLVDPARHVEVQIFGDGDGGVLALGQRDCSLQRRNQKVIEETPPPGLPAETLAAMDEAAVRLGAAAQYRSAGTVEFVVDARSGAFYFLEVNTRIQVEHGVTEEVTGIDLVEWMVRLAAGEPLPRDRLVVPRGAAIQARLYAEDPARAFQPSAGLLTEVAFPTGVRVETGVDTGSEVSPFYDPLLAKIIARGDTREAAREKLIDALARTRIAGVETNGAYLRAALEAPGFVAGKVHTRLLETVRCAVGRDRGAGRRDADDGAGSPRSPRALGRGRAAVGADGRARRSASPTGWSATPRTPPGSSARRWGPRCGFARATTVAVTGADMQATVDGVRAPRFRAFEVPAGAVLQLGAVTGPGARAYLAIRGGLDVPAYLGSRATFTLGQFGGHGGRALQAGDVLHPGGQTPLAAAVALPVPDELIPSLTDEWEIAVMAGPHTAPDFFAPEDMEALYATRLARAPQLQPHGRALDRPQAALGAHGRRRSGPAPVEHSRQRLRDRDDRFHGRHAGHPGSRRSQPGRVRLPGHHHRGRPVEDGSAEGGRRGPLRARHAVRRAAATRRARARPGGDPRNGRAAARCDSSPPAPRRWRHRSCSSAATWSSGRTATPTC